MWQGLLLSSYPTIFKNKAISVDDVLAQDSDAGSLPAISTTKQIGVFCSKNADLFCSEILDKLEKTDDQNTVGNYAQ